ncbi:MAG TPA: hypothetical protein VFE58_13670 [Tepidisphaeraceae bacterium]|jgi:hypothetical protein|nr:hypothetical protein [Tepidisphaeraceae bacterium]
MAMFYAHGSSLLTLSQIAAGATQNAPAAMQPMRRTPAPLMAPIFRMAAPALSVITPTPRAAAIAAPAIAALVTPIVTPPAGTLVPFQDVGLYKPLMIMIHEIWTGKYPASAWLFSPAQSMMVTSAMKGILQTSAAPRALNFLSDKLPSPQNRINTVQAPQLGSPLVCYIPAVTTNFYSLTIEMGFNTFNQDLFTNISSLLSQAGNVPLFMPYSPYILAAGTLAKLAGDLGKLLFNAGTVLSHSEPLTFGLGGNQNLAAGYYFIVPDTVDGATLSSQFQASPNGQVLDKNGSFYTGDIPYIVISIDGAAQDDSYKTFAPLATTAAQLSTFFNIGDNSSLVVNDAVQGAQLANDLVYRHKANTIQKQISALPPNSTQLADLQTQLAAYVANIQSLEMKPPAA